MITEKFPDYDYEAAPASTPEEIEAQITRGLRGEPDLDLKLCRKIAEYLSGESSGSLNKRGREWELAFFGVMGEAIYRWEKR